MGSRKNGLKDVWKLLRDKRKWKLAWKPVLTIAIVFIAIYSIVSLFLGLGYFFLLLSVYYAITGLFVYYPPSRRILLSPFGIKSSPDLLVPLPWTLSRITWVVTRSLLMLAFVFIGLRIIFTNSFCEQNLFIC